MADAWEILYDNSTLATGDAWEHLNNQVGGEAGPGGTLVLADGLQVDLDQSEINATIDSTGIFGDIDTEPIGAIISTASIQVEVDTSDISVALESDKYSITINDSGSVSEDENVITKIAGQTMFGNRAVVTNNDGHIILADKDAINDGKRVIGITKQSAALGTECLIAINGNEITELGWNWNINTPIYLGDDGLLIQVPPTEGFVLIVAVPLSPTAIRVRVEMPIFL